MKNNMEKLGGVWLSRTAETAQGTYQASNLMRLPWGSGSRLALDRARSDDRDRITGVEGPTLINELNRRSRGSLSMDAGVIDFITFISSFFYGACTNSSLGSYTKKHIISPLASIDMPTFTAYQKLGNAIFYERFDGCGVNSFDLEISKDDWIKASCDIAGLGKSSVSYIKAAGNISNPLDATLTLSEYTESEDGSGRGCGGATSDVVSGATDAERLANIYKLEIQKADGTWVEVTPTACEAANPSIITFNVPMGLTGGEPYRIHYNAASADSWQTAPALTQESPLKLSQASLLINGLYDGSAFFGGSDSIDLHWNGVTIHGENNLIIKDMPGSGKIYGSSLKRGQRIITIKLSKQMRDTILHADIDANATLSLQVDIIGALIEPGYHYEANFMFPLVGISGLNVGADDKYLTEDGDLIVLEDPTHGFGNVVTTNKTTNYLA